ncbi:hypothetical protein AAIE21_22160 [Paenibacillus sp. 102]|uniref:hypothetical protein n=1 Tax=Paenibacillus sp. 102 TaxID=3120823 RepID=UPI0031BB6304
MLVGSEYEILSRIASSYKLQKNSNNIVFSLTDYKVKFQQDDRNLQYLEKLELQGFITIKNEIVTLNITKWCNFFVEILSRRLVNQGYKYDISYDEKKNLIMVSQDDEMKTELKVNFDPNATLDNDVQTIHFCYLPTLEYYLHWFILINDDNALDIFSFVISNKLKRLNIERQISFNFFSGLDPEDINQIYYVTIKEYFKELNLDILEHVSDTQILYETVKTEEFDAYFVKKGQFRVAVIKIENKIKFITYDQENILVHNTEVENIIINLKGKLIAKVNEFNSIRNINKLKVIDNSRKVAQLLSIILVPINGLILLANSLNISFIKQITENKLVFWGLILLYIITFILTITTVVVPSIRINTFSWSFYKKTLFKKMFNI